MTRKQSRELIAQLNRDGAQIAARFGLVYRCIEAERANVKRRYGVCYSDGTIRIRLRHAVSGKPLKYSSLVSTLCHELAHLKHFDHSPRFRDYNRRLLEWARGEGIYRPRRGVREPQPTGDVLPAPRPRLPLFDLPIDPRGIPTRRRTPTRGNETRPGAKAGAGSVGEQLSLFG